MVHGRSEACALKGSAIALLQSCAILALKLTPHGETHERLFQLPLARKNLRAIQPAIHVKKYQRSESEQQSRSKRKRKRKQQRLTRQKLPQRNHSTSSAITDNTAANSQLKNILKLENQNRIKVSDTKRA
ncbi:MAG: hypothetical protein C0473_01870 [Cyanobacteria bacterium DS3.002]|nr:hypothetical protein [Cyanobacteria bacterium DS3.002]MBA4049670.1 hypothetical protein [Cyanobacteria bacterium DS2.008]